MLLADELSMLVERIQGRIESEADQFFIINLGRYHWKVQKKDLEEFLSIKGKIVTQPDTSLYYPGNYEHLIDMQNAYPLRRMAKDGDANIAASNQDSTLSFELSSPSNLFVLNVLQNIDPLLLRRRILLITPQRMRIKKNDEVPLIEELFSRYTTIKIRATLESLYYKKRTNLRQVAEASLFHLSYGSGAGLNLSRSWEREYYRLSRRRNEEIQFPRRIYISDLVSYYQLALSSESLILGYLALYKILEFFFTKASEKVLHQRLSEKLVTPEFSHKKVLQLRQLTSLVRKHDQKMDEQKMLTTVIENYFSSDEIRTWVNEYENTTERYYTSNQTIFGTVHFLDLTPENLAPSLSKRIYFIRNAIVHNKEGEYARFVPFSGQEEALSKEVPILIFLAEQLIIKTGDDL